MQSVIVAIVLMVSAGNSSPQLPSDSGEIPHEFPLDDIPTVGSLGRQQEQPLFGEILRKALADSGYGLVAERVKSLLFTTAKKTADDESVYIIGFDTEKGATCLARVATSATVVCYDDELNKIHVYPKKVEKFLVHI